jgi:hypothetical protein
VFFDLLLAALAKEGSTTVSGRAFCKWVQSIQYLPFTASQLQGHARERPCLSMQFGPAKSGAVHRAIESSIIFFMVFYPFLARQRSYFLFHTVQKMGVYHQQKIHKGMA